MPYSGPCQQLSAVIPYKVTNKECTILEMPTSNSSHTYHEFARSVLIGESLMNARNAADIVILVIYGFTVNAYLLGKREQCRQCAQVPQWKTTLSGSHFKNNPVIRDPSLSAFLPPSYSFLPYLHRYPLKLPSSLS